MTPTLVLDCSVLLATLLPDETSPLADGLIEGLMPGQAIVPQHWPLEVANGLLFAMRKGRIDDRERREALEDARLIAVSIADDTSEQAWSSVSDLALRSDLTIYDAAYLDLAQRFSLPLATLDRKFAQAAKQEAVSLVLI